MTKEKPARILCVDDTEAGRYAVAQVLRQAGFEVIEAASGAEALRLAAQNPDLILLDVNLPDIDGFEVCKRLKAAPASAAIPVVHLSATYVRGDEMARGLEGGADGYLTQPLEPPVLLATVRAFLRLRAVEAGLREAKERLDLLLTLSPAVIYAAQPGGDYAATYVSPSVSAQTGFSAGEFISNRGFWAEHIHPEDRARVFAELEALFRRGWHVHEYRFRHRNGSWRWMHDECRLLRDARGAPREIFGFWTDITERRQAEERARAAQAETQRLLDLSERSRLALLSAAEDQQLATRALRDSEQRFRGLVEQSLTGIYISQDGAFVYANPRLEEVLGYGPGELVGVRLDDLVIAEDLPLMQAQREALRAGAATSTHEVRVRRRDGGVIELGMQGRLLEVDGVKTTIGMAQDITEKKRAEEEIQRHVARLQAAFMGTVDVTMRMSEMRDPYTAGHERRVAEIAAAIGAELGLDAQAIEGLRVAGQLHDVGKIAIPAEILSKPGRLSPLEYRLIQGHPEAGRAVLQNLELPWPVAEVALQHHERMDGSGYPQGVKGEAIPLEARIVAVADVIEAMASHRPYRPGLGIDKALAEIERGRGTAYDAAVADACLKLFRQKGYAIPV